MLGNVFGLLVSFNYLSNERLAEHQMTFEDEMTCIKVQGVPYYWARFVFVIFSGSRAHTEELFIAIG